MKQKLLNKFWLRVGMIVAVMTTALAGTAWAETVTFTAGTDKGETSVTKSGVTISMSTMSRDDNYRTYANTNMIVTSTVGNITKVEVTCTGSGTSNYGPGKFSGTGYSYSGYIGTWTGSATSVTLSASAQVRITQIVVTIGGSTPSSFTVTYDANGGSGTMTDPDSPYASGATVTVLDNDFTRDGYDFVNWNTAADGSGTSYDEGDTFPISANTTLYAQWEEQSGDAQWVLTSLADLTSSDVFVIVGNGYAMTNNNGTSSAPATFAVTIEGNTITSTVDAKIQWTVSGNATNGYTFYPKGSTTTWLYCSTTAASGSNNNMKVGTGDRKVFELNTNNYLVTKDDYTTRYLSIYNNQDWRGYTNTDLCPALSFYKKVTGGIIPPSITASANEIAYDATSGSITYSVVNPVEGGVVTATSSESWLTVGAISSETIAFTCEANTGDARTATVTLTYTYNTTETVTTSVTVTQAAAPVIYTTIPALFEKATEVGSTATDVNVTFNNWVVSAISTNGKNVFVTDNAGNGFIIYDTNGGLDNTYSVGNILSGTAVACKVQKFNGSAEVTGLNASDLTITTGGSVTAANVAMADLAGVNTGALVSYENLTCSVTTSGNYTNYDLTDGTTTIRAYTTLYDFTSTPDLEDGKTYNITGVYQQYSGTKEILPRSAADIEEVTIPHTEYTLTVSNLSNVEMFVFDADDDTNPLLEGEGNAQILDGTEVLISVSAVESYVLQSLVVDGVDVTSQIDESGTYTFTMPEHDVTVTASAVASNINTYTLATTITSGKHYVIASGNEGSVKVMSNVQNQNNRGTVNGTVSGTTLSVNSSAGAAEVVIYGPNAKGFYSLYDARYKVNNIMVGGYLYAAGSSNNNYLRTQTVNNDNGQWAISLENGKATIVAQGSNTNKYMRYNDTSTLFSCYSSATKQKDIFLYEKVGEDTPTETRTLNSEGYATYASQNAFDLTNAQGFTAWAVSGVDGTAITFSQYEGLIPSGTGILLKGEAGATVTLTSATGVEVVPELPVNKLEGVTSQKTITADQYYGLSGKTFVKVNAGNVPAGRALLPASVVDGEGTPVNAFTFNFDEDATAIKAIDNGQQTTDGVIYNVAGQRLSKMQKGINIVNGRKVLY